jgi:anti-anti-sigma factor
VEAPIAPKFGPLADFARSPLASMTDMPSAVDPERTAELVASWTKAGVELYRPEYENVDAATSREFQHDLLATIDRTSSKKGVAIDLSGIEHMSSVGLRALSMGLRHAKSRDIQLFLWRPTQRLREVLAISRHDKLFQIVDDLDSQSIVPRAGA